MELIVFWVIAMAFLLFFYGPWQRQCEDWGRQELFDIRDEIFNMAANGQISFEDQRYIVIRKSINGLIRFMHECTWARLLYISLILRREKHARWRRSQLEIAVRKIEDPEIRKKIETMMVRMGFVVFLVMIERSAVLFTLATVANFIADMCASVKFGAHFIIDVKTRTYRRFYTIAQRDAEYVEQSFTAVPSTL